MKITNTDSDTATGYESIKIAGGKLKNFVTAVPSSEGELMVVFADLMVKSNRIAIKARQCGSGDVWTVEEIKRL